MAGSTVEKVQEIVEPLIEKMPGNIELIEVEYKKEGPKWFLRLYIDKPGGISLDDCENVHQTVVDAIDEADPIKNSYVFEVCSPGLDRPLKNERDFERNIGELLEISLYSPDESGNKQYAGWLQKYEEGTLIIKEENTEDILSFDIKKISLVKKAIRFN